MDGKLYRKITAIVLSLVLLGASIGIFTPQAYSQPPEGTLIKDLVIPNSDGVGIGFDGTYLYWLDLNGNTLHKIDTDGNSVADIPINGCTATVISYDASRDVFWGMAGNQISLIDPDTGVCTPQFTVNLDQTTLVDGLDYDPSDDTLWYSPDFNSVPDSFKKVYHVDTDGTLLESFTVDTAECGFNYNSGIAAGSTNVIYLAADGCDRIFKYDKDGNKLGSFVISAQRHEDMECDNVTFADLDTDAIWIKDALDDHIRAFAVPKGTCIIEHSEGKMYGSGKFVDEETGKHVGFKFNINCDIDKKPQHLMVSFDGKMFLLDELTNGICFDDDNIDEGIPTAGFDTYSGSGNGKLNFMPDYTIDFTFKDAGEPGGDDFASIVIRDTGNNIVLSAAGELSSGNIQADPRT